MVDTSLKTRHYNIFIPAIGWHVAVLPVGRYLANSASFRRDFFLKIKYLFFFFLLYPVSSAGWDILYQTGTHQCMC